MTAGDASRGPRSAARDRTTEVLRALAGLHDPNTGRSAALAAASELFDAPATFVDSAPGCRAASVPGGFLAWPSLAPDPSEQPAADALAALVGPLFARPFAPIGGMEGSGAMLAALAASTSDPVWVLDGALRLTAFNPAFLALMEEFSLRPTLGDRLDGLPEPHRTRHERLYARVLRKGSMRVDWTTPDRSRVFDVSLHPIGAPGEADGVAVYCRDVTESRRQAGLLQRARDEAVRADRAKSDFLAQMSHEIRTPLNAILGLTELALDAEVPAGPRALLEKVRTNSASLLHLVSGVLDFTRIEAGRLEITEAPMDVGALVREAVEFLAHRAEGKGLTLGLALDPELPSRVSGDANRIRQVVVNLVDNALKYTREGRVDVGVARRGHEVVITVTDTGLGIPADEHQRVFRQFHRVEGAGRESGAGLGLAISHALVERMGGSIALQSELGRGSSFTVRLPLQVVRWGPSPGGPVASGGLRRSLAILVVDDSPDNRAVTRALLERVGHRVEAVGDGLAALSAIGAQRWDLVLMDVHMPGMDGLEVARRVRAACDDVPILALTAHAIPEIRARCLAAGMDGYVTKPVRAATLEEEVLTHARRVRVLAVDDAADTRLLLRLWLERAGAHVELAQDAREALIRASEQTFDVILLDHELPDMDGARLAGTLRDRGYTGPFGLITGHTDPSRRPGWDGLAAGVLVKPITGEGLTDLVTALLARDAPEISVGPRQADPA